MKIFKILLSALVAVVMIAGSLYAAGNIGNTGYTCVDVAVTSGTVPTVIASPGRVTTWIAHVESSPASDPVRFIFYKDSTPPTAVPSPAAYIEKDPGADIWDGITCNAPSCVDAIGQGVAAYLKSGSTAITVNFCSR